MTTSIAKLGFEIDTTVLQRAKQEAQGLGTALVTVADAAEKATTAVTNTTTAVKEAATAEKQEGDALENVLQKRERARDATGRFIKTTNDATDALKKEKEALDDVKDGLEDLPGAQKEAAQGAEVHRGAISALLDRLLILGTLAPGAVDHLMNLGRSGMNAGQAFTSQGGLVSGLSSATGWLTKSANGMTATTAGMLGLGAGVGALATGYAVLVNQTYAAEEAQALLQARLENVTGSTKAAVEMMGRLRDLAGRNGMSLETTANSFLRLARNNEGIGLSRSQLIDLTDTVQKLGAISGATQGEISGGLMQFSQALAAGRLNGDELRSIMENLPELTKQIAEGLGVSVGQLRAMGAEGQLTSDKIVGALLGRMGEINAEFATLPENSERAFARMNMEWDRMLAAMGESLNASEAMQWWRNSKASVFGAIADSLEAPSREERRARLERELAPDNGLFDFLATGLEDGPAGYGAHHGGILLRHLTGAADPRVAELQDLRHQDRFAANQITSGNLSATERNEIERAPWTRAQPILQELDKLGAKSKEINQQIAALEGAWAKFQASPELFSAEETQRMQTIPGVLAALNTQLANVNTPLETFANLTARMRGQSGADFAIAEEAKGLIDAMAGVGKDLTMGSAIDTIVERRIETTRDQTKALDEQIHEQDLLSAAVGKGAAAQREAEVAARAYSYQIETFGQNAGPDAIRAVEEYAEKLLELKEAQDAVTASQRLMNEQTKAAELAAIQAVIDAGGNAGEQAAAARNARLAAELAQYRSTPPVAATEAAVTGSGMAPTVLTSPLPSGGAGVASGGSAGGTVDAAFIVEGLVARGMPRHIAQGFAGNAAVESGYNPAVDWGDGGNAWGLFQWNDRREAMVGHAGRTGRDWQDPNQQLDFVMEELFGRDWRTAPGRGSEARAWDEISGAGSAEQAALLISKHYERPGTPHNDRRVAEARAAAAATPGGGMRSSGSTPSGVSAADLAAAGIGSGAAPLPRVGADPDGINTEAVVLGFDNESLAASQAAQNELIRLQRERELLEATTGADAIAARQARNQAQAESLAASYPPDQQPAIIAAELARLEAEGAQQSAARLQSLELSTEEMLQQAEFAGLPRREREIELRVLQEINAELRAGRAVDASREAEIRGAVMADWEAEDVLGRETRRAADVEEIWSTAANGIGNALRSSLRQAATEGKVDVEGIVSGLLVDVSMAILDAFVVNPMIDGLTKALGNWGATAFGGAAGAGAVTPSVGAHGMTMYASGGVLGQPTAFAMGHRFAMGGENGPEAILPLQRDSSGRLGVGGGGGGTVVQVYDQRTDTSGPAPEVEERRGSDGRRIVSVTIRDEVRRQIRSGDHDTAMKQSFGATRRQTQR